MKKILLLATLCILFLTTCTVPHNRIGIAVRPGIGFRQFAGNEGEIFHRMAGLYGRYYGHRTFRKRAEPSQGVIVAKCYRHITRNQCRIDSVALNSDSLTKADFVRRVKFLLCAIKTDEDPCTFFSDYTIVFSRDLFYALDSTEKPKFVLIQNAE